MTFEQFSDGTSFLHRADPRGKLISTSVLSLVIGLSQNWGAALLGFLLALVLVLTARLAWTKLFRRLLIVNSFNLLLCLILPLTYTGDSTFSFFGINLNSTGLFLGLLITVKSNAVILLFISLLATSTTAQLGHSLQQLRLSPKLCLLLLFSYRYIALIQQELFRLQRAATLRGFQPGTNLHTYRTYSYMLGMMLVRSWNRAARVQQAMELRGFSGQFYSLYDSGGMRKSDLLLSAVLLLAGAGLVVIEILTR
jgi:cobalt/nickel transport system permease protein